MEQEVKEKRYLFRYSFKDNPKECTHDPCGRKIVDAEGIEDALDQFYRLVADKFEIKISNIEILGPGRRPL